MSSSTSTSSIIHGEINPNKRSCSVLLNEFNYLPWSHAVTLTLGGRSKIGYINGNIKPPETTSTSYDTWLCNDQLVMSWMLNSMEPKLSELFSYSESSYILWEAVKEILKNIWNELDLYRLHTTDSAVLLKKVDADKVFQILASLGSEYEDLKSHLLMTLELPSFASVCQAVQREKTYRKVMSVEIKTNLEPRAFNVNYKSAGDKQFKGRRSFRDVRSSLNHSQIHTPKAYHAANTSTDELVNFTSNLVNLINEFAAYIQRKKGSTKSEDQATGNPIPLLGKFAEFLADSECVPQRDISGITSALSTALNIGISHDVWIIDSGATDHKTSKVSSLH
ncbi:uncharacterized protein [Pyrus communis]|uniref:uncharacterized protein n=1 Tax=Pyrus communis TaxID=23211 RepID=UPI0035C0CA4E